jgi:hypothetical protein
MAGLAAGCGAAGPEGWPEGRPRVERLAFVDRTPQAPSSLLFEVDFVDADGDLGAGAAELGTRGGTRSRLSMEDVYEAQFPPLAQTATAGRLALYVELGRRVRVGERVTVELVLEDGAGRRSNRPSVTLEAR